MNYGSILNTCYNIWISSAFFACLKKIYAPFARAYNNLALVKLLRRPDAIQSAYEGSLFSRIVRFIFDLILKPVGAVSRVLAPVFGSSRIVQAVCGSIFLSFEFILGAGICGIFIVPHDYWNNAYAVAIAGGLLVLYLLLAGAGKRQLMYPEKLGLPFLLFVIALIISLFHTQNMSDSLRVLMFFAAALIFTYVIAADITDEKRLVKLLAFIYAAVVLTAIYAVIQRRLGLVVADASFTDMTINAGIPSRITSTLDNPNNYAEFLVLFTPLCAALAGSRKSTAAGLALMLGLAFPAVALIMTYSRSGWISIMLAVLVYVWLRNKKLIPVLIMLAVAAVPFLPASIFTRLTSFVTSFIDSGYVDTSAMHRFALWEGVGYMLRDYGVTGIGLGPVSFSALYPLYSQPGATEGAFHTQSLYLELMLELGILGFVSFIWMILRNIKNSVIECRHSSGAVRLTLIACASAFLGIAFCCIVEYIWFYPRDMFAFFILLGVSFASIEIAKKT